MADGSYASLYADANVAAGTCFLNGDYVLDERGAGSDEPHYSTDWTLSFADPERDYYDGNFGSSGDIYDVVSLAITLDTAPGVATGTIDLYAQFTYGFGSASFRWTLVDAALERQALEIGGTDGDDIVLGGRGADTIRSGSGSDKIYGGAGRDAMFGGTGDDLYVVTAGDTVHETTGEGFDVVVAGVTYKLGNGQEIERLVAVQEGAAVKLYGNDQAQAIIGNQAGNVLDGREGDDVVQGFAGDDSLFGGAGEDQLDGGLGKDRLSGGAGDDRLDGLFDADTLIGGAGRDTFVFRVDPGPRNTDHILDFRAVDDTIALDRSVFPALEAAGVLASSAFKDIGLAGARVDGDDRILYNSRTGTLSYDADGSGEGRAVVFAALDNRAALTFQDFVVT